MDLSWSSHGHSRLGWERLSKRSGGNLSTLNPCLSNGTNEWSILQQISSPLFDLDPVTLRETPVLALSWTVDPWTGAQ